MSRRNGPKLELKLNLSPPRVNPRVESTTATSSPSSCVSSEMNQLQEVDTSSTSPDGAVAAVAVAVAETITSMVLVGCPRYLIYVMLSENDPKCPKCKSSVLLDFLHDTAKTTTIKTRKSWRLGT